MPVDNNNLNSANRVRLLDDHDTTLCLIPNPRTDPKRYLFYTTSIVNVLTLASFVTVATLSYGTGSLDRAFSLITILSLIPFSGTILHGMLCRKAVFDACATGWETPNLKCRERSSVSSLVLSRDHGVIPLNQSEYTNTLWTISQCISLAGFFATLCSLHELGRSSSQKTSDPSSQNFPIAITSLFATILILNEIAKNTLAWKTVKQALEANGNRNTNSFRHPTNPDAKKKVSWL